MLEEGKSEIFFFANIDGVCSWVVAVAEEMPDTIPYKSRDSADEEDENDGIKLPGAEVNEDAVKPAKGKDRAYTPFFSLFSFSPTSFCYRISCTPRSSHHSLVQQPNELRRSLPVLLPMRQQ